jgi:hypothetical protein
MHIHVNTHTHTHLSGPAPLLYVDNKECAWGMLTPQEKCWAAAAFPVCLFSSLCTQRIHLALHCPDIAGLSHSVHLRLLERWSCFWELDSACVPHMVWSQSPLCKQCCSHSGWAWRHEPLLKEDWCRSSCSFPGQLGSSVPGRRARWGEKKGDIEVPSAILVNPQLLNELPCQCLFFESHKLLL